jgi:Uma2 family endonuclease
MNVRLRIDDRRYRVPDLAAVEKPYRREKFLIDVPAITVEITSPKDTFDCVMDKCLEYEALGVHNVLVMDPDNRLAWMFEQNNLRLLPGASSNCTSPTRLSISPSPKCRPNWTKPEITP